MTPLEKRVTDLIRRLEARMGLQESAIVEMGGRLAVLEQTKGLRYTWRAMTPAEEERAGMNPKRRKGDK